MKLLNTVEVSERLGVIPERVRQLIKKGRLPAEKVGRDYVIKESHLALVANRKTGRPPKDAQTPAKKSKAKPGS